jgi:hypothetical protein
MFNKNRGLHLNLIAFACKKSFFYKQSGVKDAGLIAITLQDVVFTAEDKKSAVGAKLW